MRYGPSNLIIRVNDFFGEWRGSAGLGPEAEICLWLKQIKLFSNLANLANRADASYSGTSCPLDRLSSSQARNLT
jgi:hypothetical protein